MGVFFLLILMGACAKHDIYQGEDPSLGTPEPTEDEDYVSKFENFEGIHVNITSQFAGAVYSIYYEYPYEEGSLVKEPYLIAKTPIQTTLDVPKHVKKLYILSGSGELIETDVKDITINANTKATLPPSDQVRAEMCHLANSKYFPEKRYNVKGKDLYQCTDLKIAENSTTGNFEKAHIWLTYLSDGGMSDTNEKLVGKIWFYTYPSEKMNTLTMDDCTFYGQADDATIHDIDFDNIGLRERKYLFSSKEENRSTANNYYRRIYLGKFEKGLNIGFVYQGTDRPQFSTPALNGPDNNKVPDNAAADHKYIGHTLTYEDNSSFKIEQNVANGFIYHIKTDNFEGNIVGMENRSPNYRSYDGDYNDMVCLIESEPVGIRPVEPILPPVIESYTNKKGYLLFEDNYPSQGDFDFNDVVLYYHIKNNLDKNEADVSVQLLASGCTFHNKVGFNYANVPTTFFNDVNGYLNVRQFDEMPNSPITRIFSNHDATKRFMPFIDNGRGPISKDVKNTDEYPYVLDIPYSENQPFQWCLENKRIDEAYNFDWEYRKAHSDWYLTPKDATLVIQFPTPDNE